ncbi:MAG: MaoC family dehydratase [Chloroflexi bacterium]|nr:MaoC family dehydratase [Chloroflexota bacterium]
MMQLEVGVQATRTKTFTDADVRGFAQVSGDENPIHLDDDYAAGTRFGQRIVHGMLTAGIISALLANDLPGEGTIYLSQTLQFKAPVFIGDTITATAEIVKYRADKRIATLATTCTNQDGTVVIVGEAVVLAPES